MRIRLWLILVFVSWTWVAAADKPFRSSSPDGRYVAVYERSNSSALVTRIVFRDSTGRVAFLDDYNERDYRPAQGRWTRSGRFFVYPLYSRGGHSPWRRPFVVADVQTRRCYTDSDLGAGDAISEFKLSDQDTISYDVLDRTKNNWDAGVPGIARNFSLSRQIAKPKPK